MATPSNLSWRSGLRRFSGQLRLQAGEDGVEVRRPLPRRHLDGLDLYGVENLAVVYNGLYVQHDGDGAQAAHVRQ